MLGGGLLSAYLQIVFSGSFAIGTGLLAIGGAVENIQQLLSIFSGFIQKGNILGIPDMGRCAGGIHDYRVAVPSTIGLLYEFLIKRLKAFYLAAGLRPAATAAKKRSQYL